MGLATKLKGVLGDYKNRRHSSGTAQSSLYRASEFPHPSNDSSSHINQERWTGSRDPLRGSEEVSPKTSKFRTESRASGPCLGQHHHGEGEERGGDDAWPRVTGLRKPNHAADPLYHQRHYKHYLHEQQAGPPPSSKKDKKTKTKTKKSHGGGTKSPLFKQLPPTPPEEEEQAMRTWGRETGGETSFLRFSHSTSSSAPQHRHHHHHSSTSTTSSFFPWLSSRSTTLTSSYHHPHPHPHDDDNSPALYTSPLSPDPRGGRGGVLRETVPSSAVFGGSATPTPDRGSIIVGIETTHPQPQPPLPPLPPPPPPRGHLPKDSLGSIRRGARRSSSSSSSRGVGGGKRAGGGGGSSSIAGVEASDASSSASSSSRISIGAVGGAGVIEQRRRRGGSSSMGGKGPARARSGSGRGSTAGLRIVHRCEGCGVDNDISRYFRDEAVYRVS
ncbi:hypothetical protein F4775DRAFT_604056 [Biscogniauxia sp. FL1348]|nr:hypothetical protein F4775DRAFT_604056 [Biscogniauxia sp. FL1348]